MGSRGAVVAFLIVLLIAMPAAARSIAFSFDDEPDMGDTTALDASQGNWAILGQLSEAQLKSIPFVTRTDADAGRNALKRDAFRSFNALFLGDVIRMFRDRGWTLIDVQTAFQDPVNALRPDIVPAGESILWALAKRQGIPGLRSPGEVDVYEKPILDRLHL